MPHVFAATCYITEKPVRCRTGFIAYQDYKYYFIGGKEIFAKLHRNFYQILVKSIKIYLLPERWKFRSCKCGKDMVNYRRIK